MRGEREKKKDEKIFYNACVEKYFLHQDVFPRSRFLARFSPSCNNVSTQKKRIVIAVHNEHDDDDDVNRWHVLCVCALVYIQDVRLLMERVSISKYIQNF